MSEKYETGCSLFDHLIDSFWASLPEPTANDLANFKKDALNRIKSGVTSLIDQEIYWTDRHLENARRMREQYRQPASEATPPNPA
jgi:hypothetical protein